MTYLAANLLIALIALLFERFVGYPAALYRAVRHPVVWMGALIALMDRLFNRSVFSESGRRLGGAFALLFLLFATLVLSGLLASVLRSLPGGALVEAVLASSFLAQRSLSDHVRAVAGALLESVEAGRGAVSLIVGRDPETLDESGIAKAAIESLAENTADGVIAPLFWLVLFGLPGAALYKAVNTADSMIGHRSEKYRAFGWASARLDDLVNYPASRLTGALFAVAAFFSRRWNGRAALAAMMRDAPRHLSPNAGWPEAAMAGALGLALGGARSYGERQVHLAAMGDGRAVLGRDDIGNALALYARSLTLLFFFLILLLYAILSLAA